jgi:hypothetical protein
MLSPLRKFPCKAKQSVQQLYHSSGFYSSVPEDSNLLGQEAESIGNRILILRENAVPQSQPLKMRAIYSLKTFGSNYPLMQHHIPEKWILNCTTIGIICRSPVFEIGKCSMQLFLKGDIITHAPVHCQIQSQKNR